MGQCQPQQLLFGLGQQTVHDRTRQARRHRQLQRPFDEIYLGRPELALKLIGERP